MCTEREQDLHAMSGAIVTDRMQAIIDASRRSNEQDANTLRRVCEKYGLPYWTLENVRKGRARTIPLDLLDRLGHVWLSVREEQLRKWEMELATERAKGFVDDDLLDMERQAADFRSRLEARRARLGRRR